MIHNKCGPVNFSNFMDFEEEYKENKWKHFEEREKKQ